MNVTQKNFISVFSDVYPEGYCDHLISEFDRLTGSGAGASRLQSENALGHVKKDMQLEMSFPGHAVLDFNGERAVNVFFDGLQACYEKYIEQFSVLQEGKVRASAMKAQRTDPGGGYHIWHGEQGNRESASRVLVYMLYLNTLSPEEAGETEFLYQQERYTPTENTMVLWPASYTHAHRGNTVFGARSKYIVTGWFYYD
jgi:hypothetical protein